MDETTESETGLRSIAIEHLPSMPGKTFKD
jgi:hypothetical protein